MTDHPDAEALPLPSLSASHLTALGQLGEYRLVQKLGEGGMGVVYKAQDTLLKRMVALKFLSPALTTDPAAKERFIQEAQAASALDHPNICTIHEIKESDDGRLYMVMACYEGQTLKDRLADGAISIEEALHIARQIAEGLAEAQAKGIVHRDIKPANIMITEKGEVKIMDFGLAISGEAKRLTAAGRIIGTPAYLSPEQAQGFPLTFHTDIYSTGVVLYELVTGVLPFDADDIGILLLQQVKKQPKPPSELVPDIPRSLERAILQALAKQPDDRFESAGAMAAALAAVSSRRSQTVDAALNDQTDEAPAAVPLPPTRQASVIRVVLADDHRILRTSLAMYLNDHPAIEVVGEADDGAQALAIVAEAILMDVGMPGCDGVEACEHIKAAMPHITIVMLTVQDEDEKLFEALQNGAQGYLLKSIRSWDLVEMLRGAMRGEAAITAALGGRMLAEFRRLARQSGRAVDDESAALTAREQDVLSLVAEGATDQEIADSLSISIHTVKTHMRNILAKLQLSKRHEAAQYALREGLIPPRGRATNGVYRGA